MYTLFSRLFVALCIVVSANYAVQAAGSGKPLRAGAAMTGAEVPIPYGWMDFCQRQPQECSQPVLPAQEIAVTAEAWKKLDGVNRLVNAAIEPISNIDHWGTMLDHWDYPVDGKGDCKIFALEKRRQLIASGFPRQALLMTIVKDIEGRGHAILTVKTDRGDFILDNLTDQIRPWSATGYRFVKRQSQKDPNVWVAVLGAQRSSALSF